MKPLNINIIITKDNSLKSILLGPQLEHKKFSISGDYYELPIDERKDLLLLMSEWANKELDVVNKIK